MSNVVYQIPCNDCPKVYIGQTSQYVHKRMDGHKFNSKEVTALKQHVNNERHSFDFDDVKILCHEESLLVRLNLESLNILKQENAVNTRGELKLFEDYLV